ncbi:MAG: ribonuclease E inhibitor RraB [Phycisphaerales bacterium]
MPDPAGDRAVLAAMASAGADLSKPAHTVHYLYFPSLQAADAAAADLRAQGYGPVNTHRAPQPSLLKRLFSKPRYSCIAETRTVPYEPAVLMTSRTMDALAEKHGGEYDGWEASIER